MDNTINVMANVIQSFDFDDVLITPKYSEVVSRSDVDLSWSLKGKDRVFNFSTPIISANMDTITDISMARKMHQLGGLGIIHRYMSIGRYHCIKDWLKQAKAPLAFSVGALKNDKNRIDWCIVNAEIICIDIAHGDSLNMKETIDYIQEKNTRDIIILAGNFANSNFDSISWTKINRETDPFDNSFECNVQGIKIGIGPGSACTTRINTGVGFPQLSAIARARLFVRYLRPVIAPPAIIADGGISTPGHASKALAAGANAVMIGGMLAGTDCTPNWHADNNNITYRGMASAEARENFTHEKEVRNVEGASFQVPNKGTGSTERVVKQLVDGIRSACSYVGAKNLQEFREKASFVAVR